MDMPILYRVYTTDEDIRNIDKLSLLHRLITALINDDKAAFMILIKDPGFGLLLGPFSHTSVASIFTYDHLDIATAVLDGETRGLIDTEDVSKDGMTPLHLAVIRLAPKLTQYFLQNGGRLDAVSDYKKFKLKHATPIDCATNFIEPSIERNVFNLLWWLCFHERRRLEIIRLFAVQSEQQHTWAKETFLNYAQNRKLLKLAALFLAAPELCWPLLSNLKNKLNLLLYKTPIENQLSLLLDVFALVGHKLAAYIRLEEFVPKKHTFSALEEIMQTMLAVESFIREAAIKKHGDTYADYYLRFFEEADSLYDDGKGYPGAYKDSDEEFDHLISLLKENDIYYFLPYMVQKFTGSKRLEIPRLIPTLEGQNPGRAAILTRAIEVLGLHKPESVSEFIKPVEEPVAEIVIFAVKKPAGEEDPEEKSVSINEFLKPVGGERRDIRRQKRRSRRGKRGGYARNNVSALVIEDESQVPPLGLLKVETTNVIGSEIQPDGAGSGNWGMTNDDIAQEVEEPVAENEVNVAAEKPAGEEENVDAEKEATVNKAEEDPEEKQFTPEYEMMIVEEKRKALLSLSEQKKGKEKTDVEEFQSMQLVLEKKNGDEVFIKLDSGKVERRDAAEREKKSKSVSVNEGKLSYLDVLIKREAHKNGDEVFSKLDSGKVERRDATEREKKSKSVSVNDRRLSYGDVLIKKGSLEYAKLHPEEKQMTALEVKEVGRICASCSQLVCM